MKTRAKPWFDEAPKIAQGVSDADIVAYGERCYEAGRKFQRSRSTRLTRDDVEKLAGEYRRQGRTEALIAADRAVALLHDAIDELERASLR